MYDEERCPRIFRRQAECFDRLMGGRKDARILDVGAGDGTMLRILSDLGYEHLMGLELNESVAEQAGRIHGVPIVAGDFLEFDDPGWDAIYLSAVIEHLCDPSRYLTQAYRLLNLGGVAIIMTGDNESLLAKVQGGFDMWVYPPEHLFYFSVRSLKQVFQKAGFRDARCRVGFQGPVKEAALWLTRFSRAAIARARALSGIWRSVNSNLLVCWAHK